MPIHIKGSGGAQEAPAISIDANGLVSAKAGNKTGTMQLPTQAGKTITPGFATQTAVEKGKYTTGNVYVQGDTDLRAENIVSGVSIFGVAGSAKPAQSVSQTFYGDGTKTASIYTNGIQLEKVVAIGIQANGSPALDLATVALLYVADFMSLTVVKAYNGGDVAGNTVVGSPCYVSNSNGWAAVELPGGVTFQDGMRYDAVVIGY